MVHHKIVLILKYWVYRFRKLNTLIFPPFLFSSFSKYCSIYYYFKCSWDKIWFLDLINDDSKSNNVKLSFIWISSIKLIYSDWYPHLGYYSHKILSIFQVPVSIIIYTIYISWIIILILVGIFTMFQLLYPPAFFKCFVIVSNHQRISNQTLYLIHRDRLFSFFYAGLSMTYRPCNVTFLSAKIELTTKSLWPTLLFSGLLSHLDLYKFPPSQI